MSETCWGLNAVRAAWAQNKATVATTPQWPKRHHKRITNFPSNSISTAGRLGTVAAAARLVVAAMPVPWLIRPGTARRLRT